MTDWSKGQCSQPLHNLSLKYGNMFLASRFMRSSTEKLISFYSVVYSGPFTDYSVNF